MQLTIMNFSLRFKNIIDRITHKYTRIHIYILRRVLFSSCKSNYILIFNHSIISSVIRVFVVKSYFTTLNVTGLIFLTRVNNTRFNNGSNNNNNGVRSILVLRSYKGYNTQAINDTIRLSEQEHQLPNTHTHIYIL